MYLFSQEKKRLVYIYIPCRNWHEFTSCNGLLPKHYFLLKSLHGLSKNNELMDVKPNDRSCKIVACFRSMASSLTSTSCFVGLA